MWSAHAGEAKTIALKNGKTRRQRGANENRTVMMF